MRRKGVMRNKTWLALAFNGLWGRGKQPTT